MMGCSGRINKKDNVFRLRNANVRVLGEKNSPKKMKTC